MGIAKIHAIKSTLKKAIDYITNEEKTVMKNGTKLVSSFQCVPETAHIEFNLTENLAKEVKGDYSKTGGANNLAYHMVQSFSVDDKDLTPEKAHQLGVQFVEEFLGGKFEYVIATHIDKGHLHNHIIFNATSYKDYKKFRSEPYKTVAEIREISDKICEENGLSVIIAKGLSKSYPKSYIEWKIAKEGKLTWKETIKNKIDELIPKVKSYSEFVYQIKNAGYDVKEGKHIAFKAPEKERYVRGKRIGEEYTKDSIINRITNEIIVTKSNVFNIDNKYIFKKLTDGFILNVPNQDYLLYLDGATAQERDNVIEVVLSNENYTTMTNGLVPQGEISAEQVYDIYNSSKENSEVAINENINELPLSDYIFIRQNENSEKLHRVAEAVAYSRSEGVVFYSDYAKRLSELKDKEYDTRHLLIKLDNKADDIKNIGKLIITYNKYLPYRKELERLKFAKFTKQKFINKHQYDLASLDYAEGELKRLGIDIENVNQESIVNQIKDNNRSIEKLEKEAQSINERIKKINEAQGIIDQFISSNRTSEIQPTKKHLQNKSNVEL